MAHHKTRREFLRQTAFAAGAAPMVFSSAAWARIQGANDRIRFACIGIGGKGESDTQDAGRHGDVVALCDIDDQRLDGMGKRFSKAKKYNDYRKLLEEMGDGIDAVTVSTPDHTHAPASVMAMRLGKHCFCQKPLTWSIQEARLMRELAAEKKLATQMGNQGTARDGFRTGVEVLRGGAIGTVKEIHVWTNRPVWPQGIGRPKPKDGAEPPKHIHWDLFVGPAAERAYHPECHPFNWRGYLDFGTGALGDMACHTLNLAFMALELSDPASVEVVDTSGIVDNETFPSWSIIRTKFGTRGARPPISMTWYDGGDNLPESKRVPKELLMGEPRPGSGLLIVGEKGSFYSQDDYGAEFVLLPKKEYMGYEPPPKSIPRSPGHFQEFVKAIKGEGQAMSNFDYASRLTETVLLGVVALRAGKTIEWEPTQGKVLNNSEANQFLHREYRKGWTL